MKLVFVLQAVVVNFWRFKILCWYFLELRKRKGICVIKYCFSKILLCPRLGLVAGQVGLGVRVEGFRIAFWQLVKLVQGFRVQDFRVGLVVGQVGLGFKGRVGSWSRVVQGFRVQDFRGRVDTWSSWFRVLEFQGLGLVDTQGPLSTQTNVE